MENKSLCLTCFADGDPAPEMIWLRNDKGIVSGGQFNIANENKCSTLTVNSVTSEESGNYCIFVRNQLRHSDGQRDRERVQAWREAPARCSGDGRKEGRSVGFVALRDDYNWVPDVNSMYFQHWFHMT
ncbi:myomesin-3-like [Salvelinus namaycush]|uniref:Myomesin-3-like n=1 Tax=Salvelinus namaycush TaxID=8040 RepID=A0A8U0UDT5_SALNM|nr:myomesin-3-like [Salvelinus namaycush]